MTDQKQVAHAVETHLHGLLPGWVVVDHDLEVGDGPTADLVCVDPEHHLALVILVEGGAQETVLSALETLSFVRRHSDVIARHVGVRFDPDTPTQLLLLAEHFSPKAVARLAPILEAEESELRLFELRTLKTQRGEALWFAPVNSVSEEGGLRVLTLESFIERLSELNQSTARAFVAEIARVDPALRTEVRRTKVTWLVDGRELCTLRSDRGELVLQIPGRNDLPLEDGFDRSAVLEPILEQLVAEPDRDSTSELESDLAEDSPLVLGNPAELLTPEELEAFRDT